MRVLVVGASDHHTSRWISSIVRPHWQVQLFHHQEARPDPGLCGVTLHALSRGKNWGLDPSVRLETFWGLGAGAGTLSMVVEQLAPWVLDRSRWLARVIGRFQPDVIHSLGAKTAGRLTLDAQYHGRGTFPRWVVSLGEDDTRLGRAASGIEAEARAVLAACDEVIAETRQELGLVQELARAARIGPPMRWGGVPARCLTNAGLENPPDRRLVLINASHHWPVEVVVRALLTCGDRLRGCRVVFSAPLPGLRLTADVLSDRLGIPIEFILPCREATVMELLSQARVYINLGSRDSETWTLRALAVGAFPIVLRTPFADEWLQDGLTGLAVQALNARRLAAAIGCALVDDELVAGAAQENLRLCQRRLDESVVRNTIEQIYRDQPCSTGVEASSWAI